jgi:parallel beta-helix repeat protein
MVERVLHFLKVLVVFALLPAAAATLSVVEMNGLDSAYAQTRTIIITDDATGGDCNSIGSWNSTTKTCRLTHDLSNTTIKIDSDGITLNGNGRTITGPGEGADYYSYGVIVREQTGVTVKNLKVDNFIQGISLIDSDNNTLARNNVSNNTAVGIFGNYSDNNTLARNNVSNNIVYGIVVFGSNNTLAHNTANFCLDSGDCHGIDLVGSNNIIILNTANSNGLTATNGHGIAASGSNNTLAYNTANNNKNYGIDVFGYNNTLAHNTANNNSGYFGISLFGDSNNIVIFNTANSNRRDGILLDVTSNNNILGINTANLNGEFGYRDDSSGSGTAGTANTYITNKCSGNGSGGSSPTGLCS